MSALDLHRYLPDTFVAKIDSPDIPTPINSNKIISSNTIALKLASKIIFDVKGFYNDSLIKNTGPMPLQVGKETTFTLHWSLSSISNDIDNAKIISSIPSGVIWKGVMNPQSEDIIFNERTNQIVWNIGKIPAGTGIINAPRAVAFQVAVIPQINQVGGVVSILNTPIFSGYDSFVFRDVNMQGSKKDSFLIEDPAVFSTEGKVQAAQ